MCSQCTNTNTTSLLTLCVAIGASRSSFAVLFLSKKEKCEIFCEQKEEHAALITSIIPSQKSWHMETQVSLEDVGIWVWPFGKVSGYQILNWSPATLCFLNFFLSHCLCNLLQAINHISHYCVLPFHTDAVRDNVLILGESTRDVNCERARGRPGKIRSVLEPSCSLQDKRPTAQITGQNRGQTCKPRFTLSHWRTQEHINTFKGFIAFIICICLYWLLFNPVFILFIFSL